MSDVPREPVDGVLVFVEGSLECGVGHCSPLGLPDGAAKDTACIMRPLCQEAGT